MFIGNIYRSPSSKPIEFLHSLETILSKLGRHRNKQIVLVGDFNLDLIKYDYDSNCQQLIDITTRFGFIQTISKPTRITDHSATLIDHIFTNQIHNMYYSGIVTYDISDHLGTYISISLQGNTKLIFNEGDDDCNQFCKINDENLLNFQNLLVNETWSEVINETETQKKYDVFINKYTTLYDAAFPKKTASKRKYQRQKSNPWLLPWLEEACHRKNELFHLSCKNPTTEYINKYKKMNKFVMKHVRLAKNKYYKKYYEKYSSNSRKKWKMLNS